MCNRQRRGHYGGSYKVRGRLFKWPYCLVKGRTCGRNQIKGESFISLQEVESMAAVIDPS